jgi:hypothetical protein
MRAASRRRSPPWRIRRTPIEPPSASWTGCGRNASSGSAGPEAGADPCTTSKRAWSNWSGSWLLPARRAPPSRSWPESGNPSPRSPKASCPSSRRLTPPSWARGWRRGATASGDSMRSSPRSPTSRAASRGITSSLPSRSNGRARCRNCAATFGRLRRRSKGSSARPRRLPVSWRNWRPSAIASSQRPRVLRPGRGESMRAPCGRSRRFASWSPH